MKVTETIVALLFFFFILSIPVYAEADKSTGKINIFNLAPEIIGIRFTNSVFYEGDVVYCVASIKDSNNDTLTLNGTIYDSLHSSSYPNYNFTTAQFICSGEWTDLLGKFCYAGITNITGATGVWKCNFTASDNITSTSSIATASEITNVTTTTTTSAGGGGGGYQKPIDFDVKELQILGLKANTASVGFTIENKGFKKPIEVVINQKILYLAENKIIVDYTQTIELNKTATIESKLVPTENFPTGLYKYMVEAYAKEDPKIFAKAEITFRYSGEEQQPQVYPNLPTIGTIHIDVNTTFIILIAIIVVLSVVAIIKVTK